MVASKIKLCDSKIINKINAPSVQFKKLGSALSSKYIL